MEKLFCGTDALLEIEDLIPCAHLITALFSSSLFLLVLVFDT